MRNKKAALRNIGVDLDAKVVERWQSELPGVCELYQDDAVTFLERYPFEGQELVYVDPPYIPETRRRAKVYRCDYSKDDHMRLLQCVAELPCNVMLSGYECDLYNRELAGWRKISFSAKTHAGTRNETVWMNFDPPTRLHDSRYLGDTFRDRQKIQRRKSRLRSRIKSLDPIERHELLLWMQEHYGNATETA
ncbi:DNA adenine methylase [Marinobacter vinifirmus]|nr:DNA adenine methylase [Marinobacter vinifirmus]